MMVESSSEKATLESCCMAVGASLSDKRPTNLLIATVADEPQPPLVDSTIGVKEPCSTLIILLSYALFFSSSRLYRMRLLTSCSWRVHARQKNVLLWLLSLKFWALMSSLAPSSKLALLRGKVCLLSG